MTFSASPNNLLVPLHAFYTCLSFAFLILHPVVIYLTLIQILWIKNLVQILSLPSRGAT